MKTDRGTARVVGGLFIVGTVAGALGLALSQTLVDASDYLTKLSLHEDRVATGALLTLIMGVALVGMSIVIYPVLRRHSERLALGYVVARTVESVFYVIDAVLLLTLLTVSRGFVDAGVADASHFQALGDAVLGARDWDAAMLDLTAFGLSALILNYALYGARLVPRWLSVWGLAGASLYMAAGAMVMYGLEPLSTTQVVLEAPLGLQEMVLAIWLIVKGFTAPAVVAAPDAETERLTNAT
ncbi:MAG TPA: DUF4386 domain-containing protein [Ilumatobacteraceae bacterium]|nr:DUF4386 domain-containing protein [Ilumatobacteraceae bacterium]